MLYCIPHIKLNQNELSGELASLIYIIPNLTCFPIKSLSKIKGLEGNKLVYSNILWSAMDKSSSSNESKNATSPAITPTSLLLEDKLGFK